MTHLRISQEGLSSCRWSTTSHGDQETLKKNASQMLHSFLFLQRDLEQDNGHFLVLVQTKSGIPISADSPQGEWDRMAEKTMIKLGEIGHPVFRATSPLSRAQLKSKGGGKLSIHCCADLETIQTVLFVHLFL